MDTNNTDGKRDRLIPRQIETEPDNEKHMFVSKLLLLMQPTIQAELVAMGRADDLEFCSEVGLLLHKLLGRFYDMGQKDATMYMPMIAGYLKRLTL